MKRFIAGAVCPSCDKMDKLFVYTDQQNRRICECAACGFVDQRNRDAVPGSADFRRGLGDDNVQVIKLVDPGSI